MPSRSNKGSVTNKAKEGSTSQNMLLARALTFAISLVSTYSQIIARTETKGIDAKIAPIKVLRFATSEIATIKIVVTKIFNK